MSDERRRDERRGDAERGQGRAGRDEGYGYGGAGEGYGYGGHGPADRGGRGRAGSVYDPGELEGYGYGGGDRGPGSSFGSAQGAARRTDDDRGFLARAGDEIASWMGDEDAARRQAEDGPHRGKGPRGYRRADSRILEDVNDRLYDAPHLDASDVEVTVGDGEVTLSGTVPSRAAKRDAEECAEAARGVRHVQNNLRVRAEGTADASGRR
jgi:osmotically-inducible protein OsmY